MSPNYEDIEKKWKNKHKEIKNLERKITHKKLVRVKPAEVGIGGLIKPVIYIGIGYYVLKSFNMIN